MSKTPDPDSAAKLPEPRLPAPKLLAKKEEPAKASEPAAETAESPSASTDASSAPEDATGRARSDTFVQRKSDAREVGIDTAFMDGLTSDLVLDGVPDHLVPQGASQKETKAPKLDAEREAEAVDADALFDAPASSGSGAIPKAAEAASDDAVRAGGSVLAASMEARESAAKSGAIGDAAEPDGVSIPPPVSRATPKAAAATGSDAPLNPATLAIGGAILAIALLLVFKTCGGSGEGEAGDRTAAAARSGAAAAGAGAAEGGGEGGAAAEGGAGGGAAEGGGGGGAAEGGGDAAEAGAAQGGGDAADEGAEGAQDAAADEQGQAEAGADETADDAAADGGSEAGEVAIVDESEEAAEAGERPAGGKSGGGGGPSAMPASSGETDPDRAAEAQMSAEELLAKAKESLKRKRYRDAYRQSTSSYHKKASDATLKVRVESACGMNNKGAAKSSFDKVSGMSERRDLRSKCREHGVRLGL